MGEYSLLAVLATALSASLLTLFGGYAYGKKIGKKEAEDQQEENESEGEEEEEEEDNEEDIESGEDESEEYSRFKMLLVVRMDLQVKIIVSFLNFKDGKG
jgi:H+/gluconate symporter-like permease